MRGPEIYPPVKLVDDDDTVTVTRRELREMNAGIWALLDFAAGMDSSDLGDEPEDLLFLRAAHDRLNLWLGGQIGMTRDPQSRKLGILDA